MNNNEITKQIIEQAKAMEKDYDTTKDAIIETILSYENAYKAGDINEAEFRRKVSYANIMHEVTQNCLSSRNLHYDIVGGMVIEQRELLLTEQKPEVQEYQKNAYTIEFLNKYVPKKYHDAILAVDKDSWDGYFISLSDDYVSSFTQCHTISEQTLAEVKKQFKYIMPREQYLKENNLPSDTVL